MKKLVLLIAVLSLFGAACSSNTTVDTGAVSDLVDGSDENTDSEGGDDSDGVAVGTDESETPAADPTAAPTPTKTAPTSAPSPVPTATRAKTPNAAPFEASAAQKAAIQAVVDADDWCDAAEAVDAGTAALDDLDFTNPVALEAGFRTAVAVVSASQRLAPPEIADDVDQAVTAFTALGVALEDVQWSFLDLDFGIIDQFDGPMELATYNIELYNFTECDIGIDPGPPPTDTSGSNGSSNLPTEGTIREQAVAGLVENGFTAEEANCILGELNLSDPGAFSDLEAVLEIFDDCGIDPDRVLELGGG